MNPEQYFFNFHLGRELSLCGEFLYNGFEAIENDEPLYPKNSKEVSYLDNSAAFIFLINHSIAFERMSKIISLFFLKQKHPKKINGLLKEYYLSIDEEYEKMMEYSFLDEHENKALYSHSNIEINELINTIEQGSLELTGSERYVLQIFDNFYSKYRYGHFNPKDTNFQKEAEIVNSLLNYALKRNFMQGVPDPLSDKEKALYSIGVVIQNLTKKYYKKIDDLSRNMNIYTTETKNDSKSQATLLNYEKSTHSIFVRKQIARTELMFCISRSSNNECTFDPLNLSDDMKNQYIKLGISQDMEDIVTDLLDEWITDNQLPKENRLETLYRREIGIKKFMEYYF
ncbi:hypothetical protein [Fructobacillus fructosus]|uniref:hypothetical protein n=1 Tax=Fructobacillus fructosus TaxID=1631 RepID=UPI00200AB65B|nr:hypothetical protein [Fructobacillus fructosus]MCK8638982.1 hypothetical protein [Fructobacillus fructosus]